MERLTTNKSITDMSMLELAHNSCYADDDRNARYRDYEMEMDARDFAKNLMVTLTKDELPVDDAEFDEEILDNLTIDPFLDIRGLIALFYRNLWAQADLYEKLKAYEDAEEKGVYGNWIPVSERLPEDCVPVNITWVNRKPEPYYADIKDVPFTATGMCYKGKWYWYSSACKDYLREYGICDVDLVDDGIEVIAWMPLPEAYKESEVQE